MELTCPAAGQVHRASEEIFARPRFSVEEHRLRSRRDRFQVEEYRPHSWICSQDERKMFWMPQLPVQQPVPDGTRDRCGGAKRHRAAQASKKTVGFDRLHQVVVRPFLDATNGG